MLGVEERSLRTPGLVPESGEHRIVCLSGVIAIVQCCWIFTGSNEDKSGTSFAISRNPIPESIRINGDYLPRGQGVSRYADGNAPSNSALI